VRDASARRATIVDVARAAGVSPSAVSFAFNDPSQLHAATVARIRDVAEELGYAANPHARALLSRRTGVIGVLAPQRLASVFENPFFAAFFVGVGQALDSHDVALLVASPLDGSLADAFSRSPVDGFVIVGLNEDHHEVAPLRKRRVPFVIVDGDARDVPAVNVDDEVGAHAAVTELTRRGHRDLLFLTFETPIAHLDDPHYGVGGRRLAGYRRAMAEAGLPWRPDRLLPAVASVDGGAAAFATAWDAGVRPTGVVAVSDAMALGAVREAGCRGLRVPDDLEVIGFDDVPVASLARPALSTVRQPIVEKGRAAAELLFAHIADATVTTRIVLPSELVLRDTTRRREESQGK
jgi:alanine racemase